MEEHNLVGTCLCGLLKWTVLREICKECEFSIWEWECEGKAIGKC